MPDGPTVLIVAIVVAVLVLVPLSVLAFRRVRTARLVNSAASNPTGIRAGQDAPTRETVVPGAVSPVALSAAPAASAPKTVLDYIDERTIVLDVDDADQHSVIRRLAALMQGTGRVNDQDAVVRAALQRELISTTGIGEGIAIPHAQCDGASEPVLAFARSSAGVDWKSLDDQPAHLIFMIAVPEAAAGTEHLRVLAQLSRSLMKPSFRAAIEMASTPADVLAALASTVRPGTPASLQ
jgi:PTS system fructose-specific IIC component